jgi:hypothetical protein
MGLYSRKEESSFCEQKEAKKLFPFARGDGEATPERGKVFCFFFSKKKSLA